MYEGIIRDSSYCFFVLSVDFICVFEMQFHITRTTRRSRRSRCKTTVACSRAAPIRQSRCVQIERRAGVWVARAACSRPAPTRRSRCVQRRVGVWVARAACSRPAPIRRIRPAGVWVPGPRVHEQRRPDDPGACRLEARRVLGS